MRTALLVLAAAVAGCYHPNITDNSFQCGDGNLCPEGFSCVATRCVANDNVGLYDLLPAPFRGFGGTRSLTGTGTSMTLNSKTGAITIDGNVMMAGGAADFQLVGQPSQGPPLGVWTFADVNIAATTTVKLTGDSVAVPVIVSTGNMIVDGKIDLVARGDSGGDPMGSAAPSTLNGPFANNSEGGGSTDVASGGGGGGYTMTGMKGGGTGGGTGGAQMGDASVKPVLFGTGGGGGGAKGGIGGGAIALFAQGFSIGGTIDVSGENGHTAPATTTTATGGGGGGSGGSILISANTILLKPGHALLAKGGTGGPGVASGANGGDGQVGRIWLGSTQAPTGTANITPAPVEGQPVFTFPR